MAKARTVTGLDLQASTSENARLIAQTRLDELYSWEQYVDNPYHIRELHNMRIAAKRLRYTLEIFAEELPE
ncbi:MAG TPA: CHAD domain-containing protein, partial [Ktedonobacteraceae bacterium]|nr:CHAD domain-containing protein [Ktedonobacteraceae bacterium]